MWLPGPCAITKEPGSENLFCSKIGRRMSHYGSGALTCSHKVPSVEHTHRHTHLFSLFQGRGKFIYFEMGSKKDASSLWQSPVCLTGTHMYTQTPRGRRWLDFLGHLSPEGHSTQGRNWVMKRLLLQIKHMALEEENQQELSPSWFFLITNYTTFYCTVVWQTIHWACAVNTCWFIGYY